MDLPLTYGQCLRKIMQSNHLSVNTLCRKMNYSSTTQLTRILNDEVSSTLITRFHHQFMLIFDWLISPAQIRELCASLQLSCLGKEAYLTRRAMHRMLFERAVPQPEAVPLRFHPDEKGAPCTLGELLRGMSRHTDVELLILGSAFDALLPLFASLVNRERGQTSLLIRHYFAMEENAAQLNSQISALVPFLNTNAYNGAYCTDASSHAVRFLTHNQVAVARCTGRDGEVHTLLLLPPQKDGLPVCRLAGDALFLFYSRMLVGYQEQMRPVKSAYPQPKTLESLLTLCQRDLFLETNRTCSFVRLDLCFHALPAQIVLAAVDYGARLGLSQEDPLMQEMIRVHEARYANLFHKQEPSLFILSRAGLTAFVRTGHMSDHLFAMRDFTPAERKAVLKPLVEAMRSGNTLQILFFRDDSLAPVSSFGAYEDMGVQLSANNTAYNLAENHSEVFISLPAFADSFRNYCLNTLIPEYCMTREESLALLDALLADLDAMMEE